MEEVFKDVVGYEEIFQVSTTGRVWSKRTSKFLVQGTNDGGYKTISSRVGGRKGKCVCLRVHRLVAEAFIPNPEYKQEVNHIDGDKTNNSVENLEWNTRSENIRHSFKTGLHKSIPRDEKYGTKLTSADVDRIKELYTPYCKEYGTRGLGRLYGVSHQTISKALKS